MRVRFAPSPTGSLHAGSARTALYNYLLARQSGGTFVLRIEDTDRERSTPENVEQILDALRWLELDWDEGPLSQFERGELHRARIEELLGRGVAYRSTATGEDVRRARERSQTGFRGEPAPAGIEAAVRLRVPDRGETAVDDLIRGETSFANSLIDDFVIARADGTPLYNFAVAVDDLDMGITHVIRGEDHLSNTPRQLLIMRELGGSAPKFAHLPLLHGPDGKKLSKRHGASSVRELRSVGFLPQAVRNYLALLGWGYDETTTFFTIDELVEKFSLERVSASPAVFDLQKLRWMNGHYIRALKPRELGRGVGEFLGRQGITVDGAKLDEAAELTREKIATLADFWPLASFFFERPSYDPQSWNKVFGGGQGRGELEAARSVILRADPFDAPTVERDLRTLVDRLGVKAKALFQPIRVAISGSTVSPGLFESLALLGKEESLARIDHVLGRLQSG